MESSKLEELRLAYCNFDDEAMQKLAPGLERAPLKT